MTQREKLEEMERYGFGPNVMYQTKYCVFCGSLVTQGKEKCPNCGASLPKLTLFAWYEQQHRVCPGCGTVISDDCRFCPQCGKRVSDSETESI